MRHATHSPWLALAATTLLLASACSSDDDTSSTTSGTVAATEPSSVDSEPPETTEPAVEDTTTTAEPIELTDSYQGVTAEQVSLGVVYIDFQRMNDEFGFDFTTLPVDEIHQAWTTALNERGGINGRSVELITKGILPVGDTESNQACVELLEDEQVFAVIGQFLLDNMLCVTEQYGHPYVGLLGETAEIQEASGGLMFGTEMSVDDQNVLGVQALIDSGELDGTKVAVLWSNPPDAPSAQEAASRLEAAGIEVTTSIEVGTMGPDAVANEAAWSATLERVEADGAEAIILINDLGGMNTIDASGIGLPVYLTESQISDGTRFVSQLAISDEAFANSSGVTVFKPRLDELLVDPLVVQCFDEYDQAFPDAPIDQTSADAVSQFVGWCQGFQLTVQILTAAGGDITPESFVAAGEGLGSIELPGMGEAFLGPDKHSAGALLSKYEWDPATRQYLPVGDPISTVE